MADGAGAVVAEVRQAANAAVARHAGTGDGSPHPLTDAGNAERFVALHSADVRYVHRWERWLVWDGSRFALDDRREVYRRAIGSARELRRMAANLGGDEAKAITKHAFLSEKRERVEATLALARTFPPIATLPDELDLDPDLLNLPNGIMNLHTGRLEPHDRARLLTKAAPVPHDATTPVTRWEAFLARIVPDPDVRAYLRRALGYSLTGNVSEHVLFFCYGTGANGKSTFLETVRDLLGEGEYAKAAAPDLLLAKRQDRHAAEVADLRGARFVTTVEVGEGRAWDEARVKWLTGGDAISARYMYGNPFTFTPTHKFWIAGNHKPRATGTDHGLWRRVHLIPFTVTIPKEEQDGDLRAKLRAELPGILRWAVEGCLEWRRDGLRPPAAVLAATQAYRSGEDVLAAFLEERCATAPAGRVVASALYAVFRAWADQNGERVVTARAFYDALEERGFERKKVNGQRWIVGLSLLQQGGSDAA